MATSSLTMIELAQLAETLTALGCPRDKSLVMAAQLEKRAQQLVQERGLSYEQAIAHLLSLMKQGWAAKEKGGIA